MLGRYVCIPEVDGLFFDLEQYLLQAPGRIDFAASHSRQPSHFAPARPPKRLLRPVDAM